MFDPDKIEISYDKKNRILYVNPLEKITFNDSNDFEEYTKFMYETYDRLTKGERFYLIVNMQYLVINPSFIKDYKKMMKYTYRKYLYSNGVARFGTQMTRITVKMAHSDQSEHQPNIFASKAEAFEYIHALIKENKKSVSLQS